MYKALKRLIVIVCNIFNVLVGGNLPPFVCVCLIVEQDQKFLVLVDVKGGVSFPAGFARWQEYPEQAAIREGFEETGLQLRPLRVCGYYSRPGDRSFRYASTLDIVYEAQVISGQLRGSIEGHPCWMSQEELLSRVSPLYATLFQDYLQYRTSGEIIIRNL